MISSLCMILYCVVDVYVDPENGTISVDDVCKMIPPMTLMLHMSERGLKMLEKPETYEWGEDDDDDTYDVVHDSVHVVAHVVKYVRPVLKETGSRNPGKN